MNQLLSRLSCPECKLVWRVSLLEAELNRALSCPLCGNRHFEISIPRPDALTLPDTAAEGAPAGRGLNLPGAFPAP